MTTCTRTQQSKIRCASFQIEPAALGQTTHWAAGQMQAALQAGWYDWDEIPPTGERFDLPITRQLAVKVLMRTLLPDAKGDYVSESAKIRDFSSLDGRYYEAILAAYASVVVHGDSDGAFRPLDSLSRAEACILFQSAGAKQSGLLPIGPGTGTGPSRRRLPERLASGDRDTALRRNR